MERYLIADFSNYEELEKKYGREPVIAVMPNGTLVCVMITGGPTEPHNDNIVVISKSYDGGKTWSKLKRLFSHKSRGVWATELYMGYDYPMMVVHTYNADCPYKELQTFVSYTYDNGESWTAPVTIAPYANGLCLRRGIKMSNGETLFPIYHTELYKGFGEFPEFGAKDFWKGTRHMCGVIVSSDGGESYTPYGSFSLDTTNVEERQANIEGAASTSVNLWEPNCVEAEDGHIIMYMRDSSKSYINCAESFDYGRTWSHNGSLEIPNADTKITMIKVNGKILLISNVCDSFAFDARKKLQIQISDDNCKTWRFVCYADDAEKAYFYPHAAVDEANRLIYVAYENAVQHYINKYTFDDLGI